MEGENFSSEGAVGTCSTCLWQQHGQAGIRPLGQANLSPDIHGTEALGTCILVL